MKFLFIVTSNPFAKDYSTIVNLVKELIKVGEVTLFFSGNGAYYIVRPETRQLKEMGARLLYCAHSAHQRGIEKPLDFFESSSTYNLSRIIQEYDKVINFN
ncbi:MAG: DsrE family protein [Aquificaceae bacterium]|nr:DsrE family protein [Aquificaceae bacterium]MDW8066758.1 DsrE family protein [Aquificaceae bacterium]